MDKTLLTRDEVKALRGVNLTRAWGELWLWWLGALLTLETGIWLGASGWLAGLAILMGCIQNAFILWTHEGAHGNLHAVTRTNDWLADLFVCGPVGITVDAYRWHHGRHHKYLGDPTEEIELSAYECIRGRALIKHVARHLFGVVAFRVIFRRQRFADSAKFSAPPRRSRAALMGFLLGNAGLLALCAFQSVFWMYFVLWVLPLFTVAVLISNFRTIVEHQPSSDVCDSGSAPVPAISRIVHAGWLERLLISPVGFYYHYEHHLYPKVPFYRLPEVRRRLQERGHYVEAAPVVSHGYLRTVWRLATQPGFQVPFLSRRRPGSPE